MIVSVKWPWLSDVVLETDKFYDGRTLPGLPWSMNIDVKNPVGGEPLLGCIKFEQIDIDRIVKAMVETESGRIPVERVSYVKGVAQAHPPAHLHYLCPHCYPQEQQT